MTRRVPFIVGLRTWPQTEAAIRARLESALLRIRSHRCDAQVSGDDDAPAQRGEAVVTKAAPACDDRAAPAAAGHGLLRRVQARRAVLMSEEWDRSDAEALALGDVAAAEAQGHVTLRGRVTFVREADQLERDIAGRVEMELRGLLAGLATMGESGILPSSTTDRDLLRCVDDQVDRLVIQRWSPAEAQELAICDVAKMEAHRLHQEAAGLERLGESAPAFADLRARCETRIMLLLADRRMSEVVREVDAEHEELDEARAPERLTGTPASAALALGWKDKNRIASRASRIFKARQAAASPLPAFLKREERDLLMSRAGGVSLAGPRDAHGADVMVAELFSEMPWMEAALGPLWRSMRHAAAAGEGLAFAPMLLVGPPGVGKSHVARRIADPSRTPLASIDMGASSEGFRVGGVTRGWGSACPGAPVETILATGVGNVVVFMDEIDKGGTAYSTRGHATSA